MADPICRWRNPYFKTVRELITVLPKEDLVKNIARQQTNSAFGSEDFFRTPYQLAAQLGLYYEDELILHTRFHYNPHPFEIIQYSDNWFKNYYVPNPYTARGFENIQPKILNVEISKLLFESKTELDWSVVKMELFGEAIGNDDILINVINTYSQLYQVKNNKLKLKEGIVYEDLQSCIYDYSLPTRGDKKGFFDFLEISISNQETKEAELSEKEIVLFENKNLRQAICDSFKYLFNNYDEATILSGYQTKNATIEDREYVGITIPKYFGFEIVFGQFNEEQSIENLKSSDTRRFFLDKFTLLNKDNNYLNNQWYEISDRALRLENFNKYIAEISLNKLKIIKDGDLFKLISTAKKASNTIYYGAPGTGKSYKVDQIIKKLDPKFYQRVTFHPEFDNASFVGGYKPSSEKKDDRENIVSYKFVPQAFAKIYTEAWKDLDNDYYLVIEEINRGNCAEIFGEIFQLLDRNSNYTVTPSKELNDHLIEKFDNNKEHEGIAKGLKLPSNLHILATMNTSDQSLFPMDSAFKRRWEWEYVPICYDVQNEEGKSNESFNFEIDLGDGSKYKWIDFIAKINNNHIKNNQALGMDKCIGNYFIKPDDANNISLKPFINKVIFYLWNDVFKDEDNKVFESNGSYEDFFPIFTNGLTKVKELFERIDLASITAYPSREEEQDLGQVAEENQPIIE
ncbi:McrB family protein [Chryseobacterium sp. YIM B08800]|uniref:McrB family protein n=1 Tax=Chryseobacterium sp. YIM B08800 TaxID=2984136 RepID=UPI00223FF474|nr:AAA family ATPase [Chryseobacterium sp. YIM B08800]